MGEALRNVCYRDITSLNQLIQFYSNNMTNLHHLTSHSTPCCPTMQRLYCDHRLLWLHFTLCIQTFTLQKIPKVILAHIISTHEERTQELLVLSRVLQTPVSSPWSAAQPAHQRSAPHPAEHRLASADASETQTSARSARSSSDEIPRLSSSLPASATKATHRNHSEIKEWWHVRLR